MLRSIAKGAIRLLTLGFDTDTHATRFALYRQIPQAIEPWVRSNDIVRRSRGDAPPRVLSISRSMDLTRRLAIPEAQIRDVDYPDYDLMNLHQVPCNTIDYIVSDQVLEHLRCPQRALHESFRVLKPGGIAVHTTCFLNERHGGRDKETGGWIDYWRISDDGLRELAREAGFNNIRVGSWGNKFAFLFMRYVPVPYASWHPLHKIAMRNSREFSMATWVIAQK